MSLVSIVPRFEEKNGIGAGDPIQKIYNMEGEEIEGIVSAYSVAPLRILTYLLQKKGIKFQTQTDGNNPWKITQLLFDEDNADFVKEALKEIMEYRCSPELDHHFEEIIRQLPFEVAMQVSQHIVDQSRKIHKEPPFAFTITNLERAPFLDEQVTGEMKDEYYESDFFVPERQLVLRKHLIYQSSRGGYNIKTRGYKDSSLDHYCYIDSNMWD